MTYTVIVTPRAQRDIKALPREAQERITAKIVALGSNPRPPGAKVLKGEEGTYRLRVGDYRVIYAIEDRALRVLVVKIGHRREVYR